MAHDDTNRPIPAQPTQRWQRSEEAEYWGQRTELRQRLFGAATLCMLESAGLKPGDSVLDIAAGTGDQSRDAARLVGPEGAVLSTDISQAMLDVSARLAQQEGLGNITTRAMNAEQLDLPENSFDAVISRFGLMLIPQKQQALMEIRRVLKPGGRLAAIVWSAPERNPLFAQEIGVVAAYRRATWPDEHPLDPFALADQSLFAGLLQQAGFDQVDVQPLALTFHFTAFDELRHWWGASFEEAVAAREPEERERLLAELRRDVRQYEGLEGITAPAEVLLAAGIR
jgi:SAM-dependent methyltransferase